MSGKWQMRLIFFITTNPTLFITYGVFNIIIIIIFFTFIITFVVRDESAADGRKLANSILQPSL